MSRQTNNTRIPWKKWQNRQGFTLAELLIVIAIIGVLSGLAFIAVWTHQRSMGQLERDGIAKQIFIAAQNHLSAARGEGYLGRTGFGTEGKASEDIKGNYYFVVTDGSASDDAEDIFNLMLPFGALDETIRAGGSYLIRYNKDSGTVLDVFYCSTHGSPTRFNRDLSKNLAEEYVEALKVAGDKPENKSKRREYTDGSILGWYGGAEGIAHGERLDDPRITIHNEEILWVDVTDDNRSKGASLQLKIVGASSNAQMVITLRSNGNDNKVDPYNRIRWDGDICHVVLDDITTEGRHFLDLNTLSGSHYARNGNFIWGEDIKVQAIAQIEDAITNIAYSEGKSDKYKETNSLFRKLDLKTSAENDNTVTIENFRHFENLDKKLASGNENVQSITVSYAEQTRDMVWKDAPAASTVKDFKKAVQDIKTSIKESVPGTFNVYAGANPQTADCLYPVSPAYLLHYDGKSNQDSNVKVSIGTAAGLFGTVNIAGSSISNLQLCDFNIYSGSDNAGALVGTAGNIEITNVLARDSDESFDEKVRAESGSAGGLIGSASDTTVTKSAAALVVKGGAEAGGLIGKSSGGSVTASYAGGHTENAQYSKTSFNVTGTTAGGLIGSMSGGTVSTCYSTCSASGTMVGGFVGSGNGVNISNCYCTGLVFGNTKGAFAGSIGGTINACRYFEIINEVQDVNQGFTPLSSVGGGASNGGITAFDASAASYNEFCGAPDNWEKANPYDAALKTNGYYNGNYNLRTVERLNGEVSATNKVEFRPTDFVIKDYGHYGDWPAPEAFVVNVGGQSGTSVDPFNP